MENIVSNKYFEIQVDLSKNRIYATFIGFWPEMNIMLDYQSNLKTALSKVEPNFTMVAHLVQFKTLPASLLEKQQESMLIIAKAGLYKVAEILPESIIANIQLSNSAANTNMPSRQFSAIDQAEAWLDEEVKKL
jgi:hypothetical protein